MGILDETTQSRPSDFQTLPSASNAIAQDMWQTGNPDSPIGWEETRLVIIVHPNDRRENQKISEICAIRVNPRFRYPPGDSPSRPNLKFAFYN